MIEQEIYQTWLFHETLSAYEAGCLYFGLDPNDYACAGDVPGRVRTIQQAIHAHFTGGLDDPNCLDRCQLIFFFMRKDEKPSFLYPDQWHELAAQNIQHKQLDPRKETTLCCLIAVLAKKCGYSHDDKDTVGKIESLLNMEGVPMAKKTIRAHIKEAFSTLNNKRE